MTTKVSSLLFNGNFETVADMKAHPKPKDGELVVVEDYAAGNNSGVLYFTTKSGTGTDDGGSVINHNTLAFRFEQIFTNWVTPKQFGGAGDDTTDDLSALTNSINHSSSSKLPLFLHNKYYTSASLPFPSELRVVGVGEAKIRGDGAYPIFLDSDYESASAHSDNQIIENLFVSNSAGDGYHVQSRGMKILGGRISTSSGYGIKFSAAADQAFENRIQGVLFKGCKYPIWARGKTVDPVSAEAAYTYGNTDGYITNCIFDGYAGASVVQEYAYLGSGDGWRLAGNHWYGTNATQFLRIKGINVGIADYFERNGSDTAVLLETGNPASYNFAGSVFYLSSGVGGGSAIKVTQSTSHAIKITLGGAIIEGGDTDSVIADITLAATGRSQMSVNMSGVTKPRDVKYSNNMFRVFGVDEYYSEYNTESTKTWLQGELYENNVLSYDGAGSAFVSLSTTDSVWGKTYTISNGSATKSITLTGSINITPQGGSPATSYAILAGSTIRLYRDGGAYRLIESS